MVSEIGDPAVYIGIRDTDIASHRFDIIVSFIFNCSSSVWSSSFGSGTSLVYVHSSLTRSVSIYGIVYLLVLCTENQDFGHPQLYQNPALQAEIQLTVVVFLNSSSSTHLDTSLMIAHNSNFDHYSWLKWYTWIISNNAIQVDYSNGSYCCHKSISMLVLQELSLNTVILP